MTGKPVVFAAAGAASAEGGTSLNAFDNALLAAGLGDINLVKVSSIMPPKVEVIPLPRLKPGALIPTAYAAISSCNPGEIIAAAIGWGLPADRDEAGVIMEAHGQMGAKDVSGMIEQMLEEAFESRGRPMHERKIFAVEHRVVMAGCAIAAVTLLSAEDLVA
jgi:arginine decarboxylase